MKKSLVHQFNHLPNSLQDTKSKTSFIQKFKDDSINSLKKSRIQNLPSYRKDNLSNRVQMVVIFQAIQIQRLSTEIQSLRVNLKDTERQMNNYISYQIQIKELTQSISKTEDQNYQYQQQIKRLNQICQRMNSQIQKMNQKVHSDIQNKVKELQTQKKVNSLQTNKKINDLKTQNEKLQDQIGKIVNNHKSEKKQLEQNNKELNKKVTFQNDQIQKTLKTIQSLQQNINNQRQKSNHQLKQSTHKLKQSNHDLKQSNHQLINQLNRLKDVQKQSAQKYAQLIDLINEKIRIIQNFRIVLKNRLAQTDQQKNAQKNYINDVINQLQQVQQKFKTNNQKFQKQNLGLNQTNNQLNIMIQQKQRQIQQKNRQIQQKDSQIKQKQKQNNILNNNLIGCKKESQNKMQDLQNRIKQLKNHLNIILKQKSVCQQLIDRLKNQKNQCLQIIDKKQKQMLSFSKKVSDQKQNLQNQINNFKKKNTQINENILAIEKQLNIKLKQLVELRNKIEKHADLLNKNEKAIKQYSKISLQLQNIYENFKNQKNKSYILEQKISDLQFKNQNLLSNQNQKDKQLEILNDQIKKVQLKLKQNDNLYHIQIQRSNNHHKNELKNMLQKINLITKQLSAAQSSYDKLMQQKSSEANKDLMKIQKLKEINQCELDLLNKQLKKFQYSEKLITLVKAETTNKLQKNAQVIQCTIKKMAQVFKINQMFMDKIIALQNTLCLLENQNLKLSSENKLLNFEMVETHKINSMQKRRNSRTLAQNEQSFKDIKSSLGASTASSRTSSFMKSHHRKDSLTSEISEIEASERKILNTLPPKMYSNK